MSPTGCQQRPVPCLIKVEVRTPVSCCWARGAQDVRAVKNGTKEKGPVLLDFAACGIWMVGIAQDHLACCLILRGASLASMWCAGKAQSGCHFVALKATQLPVAGLMTPACMHAAVYSLALKAPVWHCLPAVQPELLLIVVTRWHAFAKAQHSLPVDGVGCSQAK